MFLITFQHCETQTILKNMRIFKDGQFLNLIHEKTSVHACRFWIMYYVLNLVLRFGNVACCIWFDIKFGQVGKWNHEDSSFTDMFIWFHEKNTTKLSVLLYLMRKWFKNNQISNSYEKINLSVIFRFYISFLKDLEREVALY